MPTPPWGDDRPSGTDLKRIFMPWGGQSSHERIVNSPLRVHMFGWTSDTHTLQKAGWALSVKQDVQHDSIQLALQNQKLKLLALSRNYSDFHFMRIARDPSYAYGFYNNFVFDVDYVASKLEVVVHEAALTSLRYPVSQFNTFLPVNAEPQYERMERGKIEDLMHFRPIDNTKNVIVDPNDVPELMKLILNAQQPQQEAIRKRQRQAENMAYVIDAGLLPKQDIHAQIITVAA